MPRPKMCEYRDSWFDGKGHQNQAQLIWNVALHSPKRIERMRENLLVEAQRRGLYGRTWVTSTKYVAFIALNLLEASQWNYRYNPPFNILSGEDRAVKLWNRIFRPESNWNEFLPGEDYHLGQPGEPERLRRKLCVNAKARGIKAVTWELPPSAIRPNGSILAYTIRGQYL